MQRLKLRGMLGLAVLLSGAALAEIDLRNASVDRLDNGMTVILLEDRNFPVVSVQMLYRVGARNESYGLTGIAHFLEHMAFRDSKNFPGTDVVSSIYARGGEWHGYTWTDQTTYFATVPKEHLDLLLRIEADRMARLEISKDDMEAERGAVLAEMHMYENYPTSMLLDAVMYTSFIAHPYRNNTIGWESDIENLEHADVVSFYERHYQPSNAVLAVVGDFESDEVRAWIEELFGGLESGAPTPLPHTMEPVQDGERRVRLYDETDRKRFMIAWRAPSSNDPDFPAFLVLQEVLGASSGVNFAQNDWGAAVGEDSILYGVADEVTTWYPPSAQDYVFVIGGAVDGDAAESEVEQEIAVRLAENRTETINDELLMEAISAVQDQLVYDVGTTEDAAHQLAFFAGIGAVDTLFDLPALVAAVSAEDVRRVARTWLLPRRRTIGWYVPEAGGAESLTESVVETNGREVADPPAPAPAPLDRRSVHAPVARRLSGGIPVIVQESDMSSSVHLDLVLSGTDIHASGIEANDPVLGYSSLSWRIRPDEFRATIVKAGEALDEAKLAPATDDEPSDDPATRLEQAFVDVMSKEARSQGSTSPALIVISGDVNKEEAFALLEKEFRDRSVPPVRPSSAGDFEGGELEFDIGHPISQAQLGYIVQAPPPTDPESNAWRLLLYIVSHGYEGRLGKEAISNRGLAYYIESRYRSDGKNGWITMAVGVDPHKLEDLKQLMLAELRRLTDDPPTAAEVEEAKAHLVGRARSAAQNNAELADALAESWIWYGDLRTPEELEGILKQVERRDVLDSVPAFLNGITVTVSE